MTTNGYFEAIALKDHKAIHQSQLAFKKGDTIMVFETAPTGWWRGESFGKKGLFPQSYVIYNKELYGENPLKDASPVKPASTTPTSNNSNNTPIVVTTAAPSTNTTHSNSNSIGSSPRSALSVLDSIDDEFDEIDRIIQTTSPHSYSPPQAKKKPTTTTTSTVQPRPQIYNTISPSSPLLSAKPDPSVKLSPRFNISRDQIVESLNSLSEPPSRGHTRKTSSPPGMISEQPDESHLSYHNTPTLGATNNTTSNHHNNHFNSNNYHHSSSSTLGNSSNEIGRMENNQASTNFNNNSQNTATGNYDSGNNNNKFKTLPTNNNNSASKVRKPITNILANRSTPGKLSLNDVNTDTPYYITRAILPYNKQALDELSIRTDDLIVVFNSKDVDSEWWVGKLKNNIGIFPKTCVEIIRDISPGSTIINSSSGSSKDSTPATASPVLNHQSTNSLPPPSPLHNHSNNNQNSNNINSFNNSNSQQTANVNQPPSQNTPEEQAIAAKIEASFSQFNSKEDMLEAIKNLAVKFVRQTNSLKHDLEQEKIKYEQERTLRVAFERELMSLKNQR